MRVLSILLLLFFVTAGFSQSINHLSDEFNDPASLSDWNRLRETEGWPNEQLETLDIATSRTGWMTVMPYTCSWFEDYRGPLVYKEVSGDFVATARVHVSNRAGTGAPSSQYSLGGIFIRAPRPEIMQPSDWTIGGEQYSFLSMGSAFPGGDYQFEVKSTGDFDGDPESDSELIFVDADCDCGDAIIQTARLGEYVIQLRREEGGNWQVHQRYHRPDFPEIMQVGICTYTDWEVVNTYPFFDQNITDIRNAFNDPGTPAQPDLIFQADYFRYTRPEIPPGLAGLDLSDPGVVDDATLLSFLGDNANLEPVSTAAGLAVY
jgi:hypothetical protein